MPEKERDGDCLISFHRHVDEDGKMNGVAIRCQIAVEEKDLLILAATMIDTANAFLGVLSGRSGQEGTREIRKITAPGRVQ